MKQRVQFCTTSDGIRIAYTVAGSGPPLVRVPGWVSHLELDDEAPVYQELNRLAEHFQFVKYDKRGTGLSDRGIEDFSIEARLRDLEAVVAALKLKKFALYGISEGGPITMLYTARNPRRVSHLILHGTFAASTQTRAADALVQLVRAEWGIGSDALTSIFMPNVTADDRAGWIRYSRESATRKEAAMMLEADLHIDVKEVLPQIKAPTLVMHARGDRAIPFERGREIARTIPGARLVPFESNSHAASVEDMRTMCRLITEFVLDAESPATPTATVEGNAQAAPAEAPAAPESGSMTLMFTDVEGSTALTDRLGDEKARAVIREHERITREALQAHGGSEIKTMGDGFMASFTSATRALQCATAIQRSLAARTDDGADAIAIRIGLNAGEPIAEDRDLFGTAVNLAARIARNAAPGEILASNVVRELTAGKGFLFADRGATEIRGFEDPVRLYELRWRES